MRIIALLGAGAIAAAGLTAATPAEAQRYGWDGYRDGPRYGGYGGRGWNRGYRGDRFYRGQGWRDRGYYRGGRGYGYGRGYYGRPRVTCRWVRGYYGPEQVCFRRR